MLFLWTNVTWLVRRSCTASRNTSCEWEISLLINTRNLVMSSYLYFPKQAPHSENKCLGIRTTIYTHSVDLRKSLPTIHFKYKEEIVLYVCDVICSFIQTLLPKRNEVPWTHIVYVYCVVWYCRGINSMAKLIDTVRSRYINFISYIYRAHICVVLALSAVRYTDLQGGPQMYSGPACIWQHSEVKDAGTFHRLNLLAWLPFLYCSTDKLRCGPSIDHIDQVNRDSCCSVWSVM